MRDEDPVKIVPRPEHALSRKNIDPNALKVLYRLDSSGYDAFLVGGGVRDLLLWRSPKDFDIATSATPEQVRRLFRNSRIIGRRFRLVHVFFKESVIEVSTFRAAPDRNAQRGGPQDLLVTDDNRFGTPREDAFRRDFTVNALYYRISDFAVIDHVGGLEDLDRRLIRVIGNPDVRFREDPVRVLRACELAARLGFGIEAEAQRSMRRNRDELHKAASPRLREELLQILHCGAAGPTLQLMLEIEILDILLPELRAHFEASTLGLGSFDRILPVLDESRPRQLSDVVVLGAILAPSVYLEVHRTPPRSRRSKPDSRARAVVFRAVSGFMERLAMPNAQAQQTSRALELLLRLTDVPEGKWERRQMTRYAAFDDALRIFEILVAATGEGGELLERWRSIAADDSEIPDSERPKRRRRRRRRKRTVEA